jgi:hypothetical protein
MSMKSAPTFRLAPGLEAPESGPGAATSQHVYFCPCPHHCPIKSHLPSVEYLHHLNKTNSQIIFKFERDPWRPTQISTVSQLWVATHRLRTTTLEDDSLLEYGTVRSPRIRLTFQRCILLPSLGQSPYLRGLSSSYTPLWGPELSATTLNNSSLWSISLL